MSYEAKVIAALDAAAKEPLRAVAAAVRMAVRAQEAIREANSIEAKTGAYGAMLIACEALKKAAKSVDDELRPAVTQAMEDTSCPAVYTPGRAHVVSLCAGTPSAIITDKTLIPADLWSTPEPKPNVIEIAKRLRAKETVPGAVLSNARSHIQIKAKEHA